MRLRNIIKRFSYQAIFTSAPSKLKGFTYAFVPQLIRTKAFNDPAPPSRIYPTSFLDGLRGLAALFVFNFHFIFVFGDQTFMPWNSDDRHKWVLEMPIIRLPYSGLQMVNLFFIVAGYVIALKPLQLMSSNTPTSRDKLTQTLGSSVFRRVFRLCFPCLASSLIIMVFCRIGLLEIMREKIMSKALFPGTREKHLPRYDTLAEQIVFWFKDLSHLFDLWNFRPYYFLHDPHLWTVPYELRSSFYVYLSLFFVSRTRIYVRLVLLCGLCVFCVYSDRWEIVLFLLGTCIAQWDIIRALEKPKLEAPKVIDPEKQVDLKILPQVPDAPGIISTKSCNMSSPMVGKRLKQATWAISWFSCLYLLSSPTAIHLNAHGYQTLSLVIPNWWTRKDKFLPILGSGLLLWNLTHSSPESKAHRLLTSYPVQYLGKISYAFYLVHGTLLHIGGYMIPIWLGKVVDRTTVIGWGFSIFVGWVICLVWSLWFADVFCREVDSRCVKASKWIEERCFMKGEGPN